MVAWGRGEERCHGRVVLAPCRHSRRVLVERLAGLGRQRRVTDVSTNRRELGGVVARRGGERRPVRIVTALRRDTSWSSDAIGKACRWRAEAS